ncbi:hypothetical protein QL919_09075 [Psychrobacter sp. APC 3426]|uniref:hypothetical protein n=1 Tax=Psychrobacter sp. APC 3426 TaxID=3035177 RepID=UPI0025B59D03|nr:hypothetical protein [Psychrobacter sp. APC 3426]MDN3398877.1 hypothetical protein [Psychrobacter sp. APC 3426]
MKARNYTPDIKERTIRMLMAAANNYLTWTAGQVIYGWGVFNRCSRPLHRKREVHQKAC